MKSNGKKIIIIIILFTILNIGNYNFIDYRRINYITKQIRDDVYLKTANSETLIISPENKTYTAPMSGYYPATYGFENDEIGSKPEQWEIRANGSSNFEVEVIKSLDGHANVVEIDDYNTESGKFPGIMQYSSFPRTFGTIEFWVRFNSTYDWVEFHSLDSTMSFIPLSLRVEDGKWKYRLSGGPVNVPNVNDPQINTWHHVRIDFRCHNASPYLGISDDRFIATIDGISSGELLHWATGQIDYGRFGIDSDPGAVMKTWVDAVGFSWDPSYEVGDNLNEGLLLSFENSTALDWMGFSLDGQANRTILGNTTIKFPNIGLHIIQVFGNVSLGQMYYSPIRYFTIMVNLTGFPISINGPAGWSNAVLQPWCTGSGAWNDPYVIEYVMIDGEKSDICIEIIDSSAFFIIRNSILYNGVFAGIFILRSDNGQLINNNCSNNGGIYGGIYLYGGCNNNTISGNNLNHNDWSGIHIEDNCYDNTISRNIINNNVQFGITLSDNSDYNNITDNFFYSNNDGAIRILSVTSENNRIEGNIIVSEDAKFINDAGINTLLISNYYLTAIPSLFVEIYSQSFSISEFFVIFNVSSQCIGLKVSYITVQMWWNGNVVSSDNITYLGNGLYNVSLTPIFVEPDEDPILLNMTISAAFHKDNYFETYLAVEPPEVVKFLQIMITENSYSTEHFNLTFFIFDEIEESVNSAIIQMWWNGSDVSGDVLNLGNGLYFVFLAPITVTPGENPILLTMIVSADGFQDKYFETYIAVDPDIIDKDIDRPNEEFTLVLSIILISSITGGIGAISAMLLLLRKRKRINEVA
jgi:parallel beta-helix repeat protein